MINESLVLSKEFSVRPEQAASVIQLIDAGNTIPFIARYRKEATGGVDDQTLREMSERLSYLRGLEKRRGEIVSALTEQGVLTDELGAKIAEAETLAKLEDLYRPYRPKKRTRATVAREKGLEPLAALIIAQSPKTDLTQSAAAFIDPEKGVPDAESAVAGAKDILAEMISEDADARGKLRDFMRRTGVLTCAKAKDEDSVYRMYYEYSEPVFRAAPHRVLAINRGEKEEYLRVSVAVNDGAAEKTLTDAFVRAPASPCADAVAQAAADAWARLIKPSLERETRSELTDNAQKAAIRVFGDNLRQLLMQPPIKGMVTLGVDPGFRTGCKLAVVDENGKVLQTGVGHFTIPGTDTTRAKETVLNMIRRHNARAVAIGNGTASREAESFIASLIKETEGVQYMIVSEAGASVYSASKLAAEEFPEYDVSLRSAVSIARRMQDPLSELVKIEPKALGVGQYQHDLKQAELTSALDGVVEGCVNKVGVELSTASAALLTHVAGIGETLAKNIVAYREENGLRTRAELKKVPKLGPKAFEQCAGFLRVHASPHPLDATGVHPESYPAARALLARLNHTERELSKGGLPGLRAEADKIGLPALAKELDVGLPTLTDILSELEKPGRDPREDLPAPVLRSDVLSMTDLTPGMPLTGTVRNVTDFGAFVDIGVHQDGLVHISRMSARFIRTPSEAVKLGDVVKVWVVDVDIPKKRIALTMIEPK